MGESAAVGVNVAVVFVAFLETDPGTRVPLTVSLRKNVVEVRVAGRLVAVVDGWYEEAAVAVEFDGRLKYTDPWRDRTPGEVLWEEKRREDELRALDVRVVRIADTDLGRGWTPVEQRLRGLLARPGPTRRRFTVVRRTAGVLRTA